MEFYLIYNSNKYTSAQINVICGNHVFVDVGYYHGLPAPPQYAAPPPRSSGFLEGCLECSWLLFLMLLKFCSNNTLFPTKLLNHPFLLFLCLSEQKEKLESFSVFCVIKAYNSRGIWYFTDEQRLNGKVKIKQYMQSWFDALYDKPSKITWNDLYWSAHWLESDKPVSDGMQESGEVSAKYGWYVIQYLENSCGIGRNLIDTNTNRLKWNPNTQINHRGLFWNFKSSCVPLFPQYYSHSHSLSHTFICESSWSVISDNQDIDLNKGRIRISV